MPTASRSVLLGEFLRARREALQPLDLALPQRSRRRTPGLRREEVAQLCGISPTWYTWIEQGRSAAISPATLVALAQGLHLTPAERAYLFEIAGRVDPAPTGPVASAGLELAALVRVIRAPAYVLDRYWNAIEWNPAAARLFRDWLGAVPGRREAPNLLRYVFTHPRSKSFLLDWEERARGLVAEFRADTPRMRDDPQRSALIDELGQASREFAAAWRSQRVRVRDGGRRSFRIARGGVQHFDQHILRVVSRPDLRMTVLVPAAKPKPQGV
ncbi:MAG TPA: helix-turn-helix transcriptional regulator [Steroidobacteraceae bacterium]|jgi:transcriptional regulator with XRE-family HTH domain|nr:helix-turn-helix transcriptional regulator [Steroidobacteraceae bacterium]